jgi:Icc-related predicted phosphoesterase
MQRFKCISLSDTHGTHGFYATPGGDILFHCGDWGERGSLNEFKDFCDWLNAQNYRHKIIIGGNHDKLFETKIEIARDLAKSIVVLQESSITIEGLKIFGSPVSLKYAGWSFEYVDSEIRRISSQWDSDCHILMTHGPALGILDSNGNKHCGSEAIMERLQEFSQKNMRLHLCGHIHESWGIARHQNFSTINSALLGQSAHGDIKDPIEFTILYDPTTKTIEKIETSSWLF